ncbi:MAG: 2'-deoxycytidine 5'-triphosphate deaminase [Robiginitomaculum sp.]|nr:2'-deoxycytidine 5'-triphosphate deaminase [Robiginitomaculum sp.]
MNKESGHNDGILPAQDLAKLIADGHVHARSSSEPMLGRAFEPEIEAGQIQPASLDLRLGTKAYRLRASFLPGQKSNGQGRKVTDCLDQHLVMHEIDLTNGAVLETGCVYLVPLMEGLQLPRDLSARTNPKSSTGRLDVFTRVIADGASQFETIEPGYAGPLYVEIAPRTFSVLARPGDRLVQIRFRRGVEKILKSQTVSIDLKGESADGIIGWRARRHSGLVDIAGVDAHKALDYWQPLSAPNGRLILDPEEFYILASKESVTIPEDQAAEMAPIAPEIGEFRAHYAGFFDPGFGLKQAGGAGSRAVLEVRGRDVPFMLRHGQAVAKLDFEAMSAIPENLYGTNGSHYQAQGLRLSKHFKL